MSPEQIEKLMANANSTRANPVGTNYAVGRYMNSPVNFTLGGEVRKAARTVLNLVDGVETVVEDRSAFEDLLR